MEFSRFAMLVLYILRNGKFRYDGPDPNESRIKLAAALDAGIDVPPSDNLLKRIAMKNSYARAWIAEAAYLKNSLSSTAAHLSLPGRSLCYIRIPRSASTSLCKTLLLATYPEFATRDLTPEQINALADMKLQHSLMKKEDRVFFTVVRNPFARLVSVYREYFENGLKPFLYEDYLFGILRQEFTFAKFVETIARIPDTLKDQHFKPQWMFLQFYHRRNVPVEIAHLESPDIVNALLRRYGLHFEVVNRREPYDYRDYYDIKSFRIVSSLYREDISRFGYGKITGDLEFNIEQKHVRM